MYSTPNFHCLFDSGELARVRSQYEDDERLKFLLRYNQLEWMHNLPRYIDLLLR